MKQTTGPARKPAEAVIKDIRRSTRRQFSSEDKIRIVLEGLRGEDSIAELCRRAGIASSMDDGWSEEFLEAGRKRLAGDTARAATADARTVSNHLTTDTRYMRPEILLGILFLILIVYSVIESCRR